MSSIQEAKCRVCSASIFFEAATKLINGTDLFGRVDHSVTGRGQRSIELAQLLGVGARCVAKTHSR